MGLTKKNARMTSVCGSRLVVYVSGLKSLLHRVTSSRAISVAAFNTGKQTVRTRDVVRPPAPDHGLEPFMTLTPMDCHLEALASMHRAPATAPPTEDCTHTQVEAGGGEFFSSASVECVLQPCPQRLTADVFLMFPTAPAAAAVTVVTVTQRSQQDMSRWSSAVEAEREQLLQTFIQGAAQICSELQQEGHWADFIEPSSGLPFYGPYTNLPLFETDDRYSLLGFTVEDLGCCKVLRHTLWGTNVFVGTIFTDAPPQGSRVLEALGGREDPTYPPNPRS